MDLFFHIVFVIVVRVEDECVCGWVCRCGHMGMFYCDHWWFTLWGGLLVVGMRFSNVSGTIGICEFCGCCFGMLKCYFVM